MTLAQALGATSPDDPSDQGYIDPQGVASGLMVQHEPDADSDPTVDPLTVAQRLLRKHAGATGRIEAPGVPGVPSNPKAPGNFDPSTFADQTKPGAFDPTDFGTGALEAPKGTEGNPYTGDIPIPDKGAAAVYAGEAVNPLVQAAGGVIQETGALTAMGTPASADVPYVPGLSEEMAKTSQTHAAVESNPLYQTGKSIKQWGQDVLQPTPHEEDIHPIASVGGKITGIVGAVAPVVAASVADPVAGLAAGAAMFGLSSASDTYDHAYDGYLAQLEQQKGAELRQQTGRTPLDSLTKEEQAAIKSQVESDPKNTERAEQIAREASALSGAASAALGSIPIATVLLPIKAAFPEAGGAVVKALEPHFEGLAMRILEQAAKEGTIFTGVGEAQEYIGQQIAKMYDPHAGYSWETERVISEFLAGGLLGGLGQAFHRGDAEQQPDTRRDWNTPNVEDVTPPGARTGLPPPGEQDTGTKTDTGPQPQPGTGGGETETPPPPFETKLNRNTRSRLEEKAAYYKEFSAADIASWDDDKLKDYVNEKFGGGSARPSDDDILRQSGMPDEEIKGMSPEEKTAAASAAVQNGQFHTETRPGTVKNPIDLKTTEDVARAAAVASQDHTPAQGEANNVQRGHATWNGLDITIEVPPGGVRRGTIKGTDQTWEATHPDAYGEFQGLPDAGDGMKPDVIVGSHPNAPTVYVIDELDRKTGEYKQSKAFIGFSTPQAVANSYLGISTKQPGQIGGMRAFGRDEFVKWAKAGGLSKPASDAMKARAGGATYNVGGETRTEGGTRVPPSSLAAEPSPPSVADHQAIEDALRQVGVDPRHVRPVDIQRAAEIHANEGFSPDDSWQLAVTRAAVEDGLMTTEDVKNDHNQEVASTVESGIAPQRDLRSQARRSSVSGAPAEGEGQRVSGGGENGAPRGNEAAAHTENEEPVRPAAGEAAELHGEAAGAGRAETERGGAGQRPTGGERAAEANGRSEREAANRNAPEHEPAGTAAQATLIGGEHTVTAADGAKIKVKPEVVEAKNLITSSDKGYDKTLQPRQRDRAASHAQIREIVTNLDPERLGYSAEADRGAPIVGPDRMVESGNGRVAALRVIYRANPAKAKAYKTWLESQGVDVSKYKEPILVRQRVTELGHDERKAFTVAANKPATLEMSAPERAIADADAITPHMLDLIKDGELGSLENRGFVRAFVGTMPASERGNLATTEGGLSSAGLSRVRNAVLAKAFGDPDIISRITESTDDDVKSISNALVSAAPAWAKMRSDIEAGTVPEELDLTKALVEAVHRTADMRAKGQKLDEYLAQRDAFDQIKPDVDGFIRNFYDPGGKRAKSATRIADFLRIYANEAAKVSAEAGLDLGLPKVTPHDIQAAASAKSAPAGNRVRPSEQNERPPKRGRGTGEGGAAARAEQLPGSEPRRGFAESDELFASEPGVDNKPQLVLPGAERIASADLAKRRAAEPLRPKKAQKAADDGLFARPEGKQIDLEEAIAAAERAPAKPAEPKKVRETALSQGRLGFEEPEDTFKPPTHRERGIPADARAPIAEFKSADAIKKHPDYAAAKSGDGEAAIRLVRDLIKPESIALARQRFGEGAIYVPVHGEEQTGRNAIPMMMAVRYANGTGGTVGHKIIQANKAFHTGAGPMERLANRAVFSGDVEPGKNYVLVDDTSVMGSTLADLADHIQRNGGKVKGVALIANAGRASILTPTNAAIRDIERRHGDATKDLFRIAPAGLTADEAAYLRNFRDADELRASLAKAQRERAARLGAKGLREGPSLTTSSDEENGAPRGAVSDSEKPRAGFEEGEQRFAPPFYSAVARTVEAAKQEKASPQQWLATIRNTPGVKPEELEWLGLGDWLKEQKGSVTKQEVADYVRANSIEVHETAFGQNIKTMDQIAKEKGFGGWTSSLTDVQKAEVNAAYDAQGARAGTKFQSYTLPGGQNYRELLLALPRGRDSEIAADRRKAILAELDQVQDEFNRLDDVARASIKSTEDELERATTRWHEASAASLDAPRGGALLAEAKAAHDNYKRASLAYDDARTEADKLHFEERRQLAAREDKLKAEYNEINPETAVGYKSPHWDERNVLAHVRFNDRVIDGKRALFLEEIQSDWHQAGKRRGYATNKTDLVPLMDRQDATRLAHTRAIQDSWRRFTDGRATGMREAMDLGFGRETIRQVDAFQESDPEFARIRDEALAADAAYHEAERTNYGAVPNAPFKTTWPELALKRMLRYAAENGYDKIAWTPGDVQAERYDLSKHISEVRFTRTGTSGFSRHEDIDSPESGGVLDARDLNGARVIDHYVESPEKIADYIGKEAAEKLLAQQGKYGVRSGTALVARELKGLQLKVGGEGMQGFYDDILPKAANKLVKKFGAKVGISNIEVPRDPLKQVPIDEETPPPSKAVPVHTLDITPALHAAATREGFALFEGRGPTAGETQEHVHLGDFETKHGVPLGRQAQEYVVGHGLTTGNEHLLAFDEGGHAVAHGYGTPRNTGITPEFEAALRDPKNAIVAHHNHPSNSGLSGVDISFLATPGLHSIWAHGHEGTVARASLTAPARKALSLEEIDPGVRRLHWIADSVSNFILPVIQRFVDAKYIGRDEGHLAITDLVGRALHRAGIIDYRSNVELPKAISETSLGPYIERAAQWAAGSLFNDKIQTSAGRQPEPLRHIGDLGTSLGRPQEVARRYAAQERPDQGGRAHDRAESAPTGRLAFAEGANPFTREAGGGGAGGPPKGGHPSGPAPQDPLHPASWSIRRKLADMLGSDAALTAKEKLQDFNARVERLQNMIEARSRNWVADNPESPLPDDQQFYALKRLFPGKRSQVMRDFNDEHVKALDALLRDAGISGKEAGDFLYAKHATERNRVVGELHDAKSDFNKATRNPDIVGASGMSNKEARAILGAAMNGPKADAFRELARRVGEVRKFIQGEMLRGGLENQDTLSEWNRIYNDYVPLRGWEDPGEQPAAAAPSGRSGGGDIKGPESKRALGRRTKADNPLVGLIDQAYRTIDRAEKNLALQGLARMLNAAGADVRKEMGVTLERGRPKRVVDPSTGLVKTVDDNFDRMRENAVHMKVRGNDQYVVFDDVRLAQAAKRWSPYSNSALSFMNRLLSRWKSALTHYNPLFMPRHMARYYVEGLFNAMEQKEHGSFSAIKYAADAFPLIGNTTRAILTRERGAPAGKMGDYWDEMKAGGGATSMFSMRDYDELLQRLRSQAASIGTSQYSPRKALRAVSEFVDKFTGVIDNSTRLAAFAQAREAGKSIQQASMIAREATVDYNLRGWWSNILAIWAPFQNVATQTGYRMGSAASRSHIMRKVFLGTFALGFASAAWNYMFGGDDKDKTAYFDKLPEWTRSKALAMFLGLSDDKGRPQPVIWPFPFNYAFPLTAGQAAAGMMFGTASKAKYMAMMLSSFVSSFSELGEQGVAWRDVSPEMMRPFMDTALNKSWTGSHIHTPADFQKAPNAESGFRWTPEFWKDVSQFLNHYTGGDRRHSGYFDFYPEDVEYILKSYLGGQVRPIEEGVNAVGAIRAGQAPDPTQIPIGSVFYGANYDKADQAAQRARTYEQKHRWEGHDSGPRKPLIDLSR